MPTKKTTLNPKIFKNLPRGVEVITEDKEKAVRREFEDSTVYVWKTTSPIVNRMKQHFKVMLKERYYSTVGEIHSETPFYRGKLFTNGITRHEFLHWCATEGNIVLTEEGFKLIENSEGLRVIGEDGKLHPSEFGKRKYSGEVILVKPFGCLPFEVSPEHLVKSARWGWKRIHKPETMIKELSDIHWIKAKDLRTKDYVFIPKLERTFEIERIDLQKYSQFPATTKLKELELTDRNLRFLGLYLAEGYSTKADVVFCFGSHELDLINEIEETINKLGFKPRLVNHEYKAVTEVRFTSPILARFLREQFGSNARNKKIPNFLFFNKDDKKIGVFLRAYMEGDGHHDTEEIRMATSSKELALQIQMLICSIGSFINIYEHKPRTSVIRGKEVKQGKLFVLVSSEPEVYSLFNLPYRGKRHTKNFINLDKYIGVKIRKIEKRNYEGYLYNFNVSQVESYTLSNIVVHNSIYPIDVFNAVKDLFETRDLLMFELGIDKKDKNWGKKFPYALSELQLYQNMLGDYLIHIHMASRNEEEWRILWQFLMLGGYQEKRDSTFKVYLAVYPRILPNKTSPIQLGDAQADKDADDIATILQKTLKGEIGKAFATKEIAKILHKYYERDKQEGKGEEAGEGNPNCPKCGKNDWEVTDVLETDENGNPKKVRIRCKNCGHEENVNINPYGNPLKPSSQAHGIKIKWGKEDIDKLMDNSRGASREDFGEIGIDLSQEDFVEAQQRARVRKFIRENVIISKDTFRKEGELFRVSTDVWRMGDSLLDVNIPQTELASLGIDDLRMIPELTLKKNVYVSTQGQDIEKLKGTKYFVFLDVSGSMSGLPEKKALAMLKETWEICKKLDFDYHLCLFSTKAKRVPKEDLKRFFEDASFRQSLSNLGGGTVLSEGLKQFEMQEYKDANLLVISDCDIADAEETREEMLQIANMTNSFKIILIRESERINDEEVNRIQEWFPSNKIKVLGVSTSAEDFSYER